MLNQFKGQSKEQTRNIKCASGGENCFFHGNGGEDGGEGEGGGSGHSTG